MSEQEGPTGMVQPLDEIMTRLGLSNHDLVAASRDQLTHKMVMKGRRGRRLSIPAQEKILAAMNALKPELGLLRRDLFRYPIDAATLARLEDAKSRIQGGRVEYPAFLDLLVEAGIGSYRVEIAERRTTYFGPGGEAHVEPLSELDELKLGPFSETAIRGAIAQAAGRRVPYPDLLRSLHAAGVVSYEVSTRKRRVLYRGLHESYREWVPASSDPVQPRIERETAPIEAQESKTTKAAAKKQAEERRRKKLVRSPRTGRKAKKHRIKRRSRRPYKR